MNSCMELRNVFLNYGTVQALQNVNLSIYRGEVRAMVGEHGAGKSTIAGIMSGFLLPDSGDIYCFGEKYSLKGKPIPAVEIVHQTVDLMNNLTVSENMFLSDTEDFPSMFHRKKRIHAFTNKYLREAGTDLKGEYLVSDLKRADWVLIDILRKLYRSPELLILDEAIEQLSNESARIIINILKERTKQGMSVIYITHRIDDVYTFADTVSIVKNGEVCFTAATENIDKINLIKIAYTQLSENSILDQYNEEFFHLLKYNEAILRNLPVSLIVVNRNEEMKIINEAAHRLLNIDHSYGNKKLETVFSSSQKIISLIKNSFQTEKVQQFYYLSFKRSDSKDILLNISKVPIYDEHFLIGNILLFHDITEQENLREEFELREKLAATGLLAAGVAHEINNPLGMILNDLHFIKVLSKDERIQSRIRNLEKHFGFITDVISNLLSFSDQKNFTDSITDLNSTIREMIHLLDFYIKKQKISLSFSSTYRELGVRISANELKQILLNLIKNSMEAFPAGGDILLKTDLIRNGQGLFVQIVVEDNGPGIALERINDIFLPFQSTKNNLGRNMGIGLSVSYNIVQKNGGSIKVDIPREKGCRFIILFPSANSDETVLNPSGNIIKSDSKEQNQPSDD